MKTLAILVSALGLVSCASSGIASKATPYRKDVCAVSGNKLGSMGTPVTKVYGSQEVKFCCKPCVNKFEKNPDHFLAKLN